MGSGIYKVEYSLDEPEMSGATIVKGNNVILTGVANGNHTLRLWAFDFAGNVQSVGVSFSVSVPPPPTVSPPPSYLDLWVVAIVAVIVATMAVSIVLYRRRRNIP